ncbi:hypothetical protein CgunFtcFv8_024366 [Champsocephalus gunnari]|uniref:Uncharacterized protein n=1 Tax=Champsocephalus gunnari TaxID=52237 RepID=A0AAN8HL80_CHAGU|nr:hypothetical protein CgunFtcFv8_024366 [Champsocephalus gunnari]
MAAVKKTALRVSLSESELVKGLSQKDMGVSEKVWLWCGRVVNVTDLSALTVSPQRPAAWLPLFCRDDIRPSD